MQDNPLRISKLRGAEGLNCSKNCRTRDVVLGVIGGFLLGAAALLAWSAAEGAGSLGGAALTLAFVFSAGVGVGIVQALVGWEAR